jgi:hypothetical protein
MFFGQIMFISNCKITKITTFRRLDQFPHSIEVQKKGGENADLQQDFKMGFI